MNLEVFTDGGSRGNPGSAAIGGVVYDSSKNVIYDFSHYLGTATNNEAEYTALLHVLSWFNNFQKTTKTENIIFYLDSKLVVEQINKKWKIKEPRMQELAKKCWLVISEFKCSSQFIHVKREKNKIADSLVNQALDAHQL